jgi:hypothetical protein
MWAQLLDNDPDTVLAALAEAFEDNEAAAAPVGVAKDGSVAEASIVVLVPDTEVVPERKPTITEAGNLSLKKLTKRETADLYKLLVCGYLLATAKEAFAVAPRLTQVRLVAIRTTGRNAYGQLRVDALLGVCFARSALLGVRWQDADATAIVNDAGEDLTVNQVGQSKAFEALNLTAEPEIAEVLAAIDVEELVG